MQIYRVVQIKMNKQLVGENVHMITDYEQSVFKRIHSDKHFSEFYLQDGVKNQLA